MATPIMHFVNVEATMIATRWILAAKYGVRFVQLLLTLPVAKMSCQIFGGFHSRCLEV